jgi:hypothetical protein
MKRLVIILFRIAVTIRLSTTASFSVVACSLKAENESVSGPHQRSGTNIGE